MSAVKYWRCFAPAVHVKASCIVAQHKHSQALTSAIIDCPGILLHRVISRSECRGHLIYYLDFAYW